MKLEHLKQAVELVKISRGNIHNQKITWYDLESIIKLIDEQEKDDAKNEEASHRAGLKAMEDEHY